MTQHIKLILVLDSDALLCVRSLIERKKKSMVFPTVEKVNNLDKENQL